MKDNKETVFVDRYDYKDVAKDFKKEGKVINRSLLNEILRKAEMIANLKGSMPKYVKMRTNSYFEIIAYNPALIKVVKEDYGKSCYIFGMKIIL